jgi:transposase
MKPRVFIRDLSDHEQQALEDALGADHAFTRRRARVLRFSAQGLNTDEIADGLGCTRQTVRNAIHDFEERGLDSLARKPKGPQDPDRIFDEKKREALQELAHQSPRSFGKPRSTWTLSVLAEVAFEEGLTEREVSKETVRQAVLALRSSWQRAKTWITSPDPQYELKKSRETV